jgi:hypothetical protein
LGLHKIGEYLDYLNDYQLLKKDYAPSYVVEWLIFLFHIREILGSNFDLEISYTD